MKWEEGGGEIALFCLVFLGMISLYVCVVCLFSKGGGAEPGFVVTIVFKAIFLEEKTYHFLLPENTSNLLKVGRDVQQKGKLGSHL